MGTELIILKQCCRYDAAYTLFYPLVIGLAGLGRVSTGIEFITMGTGWCCLLFCLAFNAGYPAKADDSSTLMFIILARLQLWNYFAH